MWVLLGSVFVASLAGSGHCAGMCGAFAVACSGCDGRRDAPRGRRAWHGPAAYHGARGASYVLAGAVVGGIGAALDFGGRMIGVQRFAAVAAGATVVLVGVATLLRLGGLSARVELPGVVSRAIGAAHRWAGRSSVTTRSITLGALSALLPCGWLWAFLAVAAGAGSPIGGAAVMAAFWAGTVPLLALVGGGIGGIGALWRGRVAVITSIAMIAVGIHTIASSNTRSHLLERFHARSASDLAGASHRLEQATKEVPACCREETEGARAEPGP